MKKIKDIKKKLLAVILLIATLLGTAQPIFAISTSGTAKWVAGQWDSEVFTTDNKTSVGMLMRRLVNYTTGDMYTTFCAEHFINSPTGTIENGTHTIPASDSKMKQACKVAYFGWYEKYGDYVLNGGIMTAANEQRKLNYCFTQQYVWETLGQSNATCLPLKIALKAAMKATSVLPKPTSPHKILSIGYGFSISSFISLID